MKDYQTKYDSCIERSGHSENNTQTDKRTDLAPTHRLPVLQPVMLTH